LFKAYPTLEMLFVQTEKSSLRALGTVLGLSSGFNSAEQSSIVYQYSDCICYIDISTIAIKNDYTLNNAGLFEYCFKIWTNPNVGLKCIFKF